MHWWSKCDNLSEFLTCVCSTVQQGSGQGVWQRAGRPAGHHAAGAGRQRQSHQLCQLWNRIYRLRHLPDWGNLFVFYHIMKAPPPMSAQKPGVKSEVLLFYRHYSDKYTSLWYNESQLNRFQMYMMWSTDSSTQADWRGTLHTCE